MNSSPILKASPESENGATFIPSIMNSNLKPSSSMEKLFNAPSGTSYITSGMRSVSLSSFSSSKGGTVKVPTGSSLNSIASSPGNEMAIVGGREILKIFSTGVDSQEILNLRMGAKSTFNLNSNDVAWGYGNYKSIVVSAAASGTIILFDLNKSEKIDRILSEHVRSVHRITFHTTDPALLLSASQDGSMKLWDLRAGNSSKQTFDGKAESARDCQFNPISPYEFAAVFDNGCLQLWDIRNPSQFERKWSAHNGLALSVGWNSSGNLLGTGGRDKVIKIWDSKSELRKPEYSIQTIASVSCVRWRPGYDTQLAACSLSHDFRIHLWDFTKPYIPSITLDNHTNITTGIIWRNSETLLSCSRDESFVINQVRDGYSPASLLNLNTCKWNSYGDAAFTSKKGAPMSQSQKSLSNSNLRPKQLVGSFHFDSLEFSKFSFFAHYLEWDSENIAATCDINADLASTVGSHEIEITWKLIKLLFGSDSIEARNLSNLLKQYNLEKTPVSLQKKIFSFFKEIFSGGIKSEDQILPFPSIAETASPNTANDIFSNESSSDQSSDDEGMSTSVKPIVKSIFKEPENVKKNSIPDIMEKPLNPQTLIFDLLDYYSEQGNPQMTATIVLLLEKRVEFDQEKVELYTHSYLELLHRFQLWPEAIRLINSSKFELISSLNSDSTSLHRSCYHCNTPISLISKTPNHCENCKKPISICSICHRPVLDIYTWCQWCSHGGHLHCLDEWFAEYEDCPSGCGHSCLIKLK